MVGEGAGAGAAEGAVGWDGWDGLGWDGLGWDVPLYAACISLLSFYPVLWQNPASNKQPHVPQN